MAGTFITKPGYWFITGRNQAGQEVAGVVKYAKSGRLPNASQAVYVSPPKAKSLNMTALQAAIQSTGATFLYEVPATGSHSNVQSIGARAVGQGKALYSSAQAGVQPTNDLYIAAVAIAAPFAASFAGAGAGAAAGAAGVAGGAEAGAAAGGAAAGGAKIASKVAKAVTGAASSGAAAKVLGGVAITALLTETGLWKGVGMVIAGAVLAVLALRQVATV